MRAFVRLAALLAGVTALAVLGLWATAGPSGLADDDAAGVLDQIRPQALRAHIQFLADDLLEGRGTGTRGHRLAANYVAARFEALGLQPAGSDGSYFQPVPLRTFEAVAAECALVVIRDGKEVALTYGKDFAMPGDPLRAETSVAAPVVFAGYGVTAPEAGYDDYTGIDARGKVVILLQGAPASLLHNQRAYYSSSEVKRENAVAHGAVGLFGFMAPEEEKRLGWDTLVGLISAGGMRWLDPAGMPRPVSPEIRATALLSTAALEGFFEGASASLTAVLADLRAGKPHPLELPAHVKLRVVSRHGQLESPNVAAVLPGSDSALRQEYVVYSAHLDHLGVGPPVKGDAIYNGATDNASGTAVLLEVARAFAGLRERPRRSVLFLAVTAEEKGLLGSDYFAHYPTVPAAGLVANVNLDGALMLHPLHDVVAFGAEHSNLAAAVEQAARQLGLELSPDPMPEQVLFVRSDQYSFVRRGVPSVFIVEGFETGDPKREGRALLTEWMDTRYHTPQDDLTHPLDFEAGAAFARVNFLIGYLVANQTPRPQWNAGDFFGEKFGLAAAGAP
jgi:hypothetical protein